MKDNTPNNMMKAKLNTLGEKCNTLNRPLKTPLQLGMNNKAYPMIVNQEEIFPSLVSGNHFIL